MSYVEIPVVDYVDINEEQVHVFIHTKDQRVLGLRDAVSNLIISDGVVYIEHMALGQQFIFSMSKDDFSHIEYYYSKRPDSQKDFDDLNSFIEEDERLKEF